MNRADVLTVLGKNEYLKKKIFCRGFCITNQTEIDQDKHPFYGMWRKVALCNESVFLYIHPQIHAFWKQISENEVIGLIGHAYNPFNGRYDEQQILNDLADDIQSKELFFDKVNNLTGTFIIFYVSSGKIHFLQDAVGLQSVFYTLFESKYFISSHSNLIGDLLELNEDPFVSKLKKAKYFHLFGNQLPGNITSFKEVRRLVPNHYVTIDNGISVARFYYPHQNDMDIEEICDKLCILMRDTMEIIAKKWNHPAISLTGGVDSKTTLACALEQKDKYKFFSYDSQKNELPDLLAAKRISEKMGLSFISYSIPYEDEAFENIEDYRKVLLWNCGNVCPNNKNDLRKRIFLDEIPDYEVEIKSWASEVGRSRYTKRYNGRRNFGKKPTPRKCTTFYKFLFFDRKVMHGVDKVFEEYIEKFYACAEKNPLPWQDQFYWEWHWPSRDGVVLTCEQKYAHEITVPYNNRKLLELLVSVPEEDRINDTVYKMIRDRIAPEIDQACEGVVDVNHTRNRAKAEDFYYIVNNLIP